MIMQQQQQQTQPLLPQTRLRQQQQQSQPQTQEPSNEELCNLLVQGLIAKDEKLLFKVLEQDDDIVIKDIINRVPVNHVRKLIIELTNLLSSNLTTNHLQWLQHLLALKYSVVSSMPDGRSILIPLISLLDDRSSPVYYNKMQNLKGKLTLLKQLREARHADVAETVVRVQVDPEQQPAQIEIESETDTESEEDFEDSNDDEPGHIELDDNMEGHSVDEDEDDDDDEDEDQLMAEDDDEE